MRLYQEHPSSHNPRQQGLHLLQPISKRITVYQGFSTDTLDVLINSCPKLLLTNQVFTFSKDFGSDLFSVVKCIKLTLTFWKNVWKTILSSEEEIDFFFKCVAACLFRRQYYIFIQWNLDLSKFQAVLSSFLTRDS